MFKSQDFRIPFLKETPQVALFDHVLFVPPTSDRSLFQFPGWNSSEVFGKDRGHNPIAIEFCSGNGEWLLEKAKHNPDWNWVAVEKRFDRTRKIWVKMKNMGLKNVFIVFGEALAYSTSFVPESSVQALYINFPDPWPKTRHIKNRIISPLLFSEAARMLQKEGKLIFVTDDQPYSEWFLEQYDLWNKGTFDIPTGKSAVENPPLNYGTSFFDSLFRRQGKTIHYHERERTEAFYTNHMFEAIPTKGILSMNAYNIKTAL